MIVVYIVFALAVICFGCAIQNTPIPFASSEIDGDRHGANSGKSSQESAIAQEPPTGGGLTRALQAEIPYPAALPAPLPPPEPVLAGWVVSRPDEAEQVKAALLGGGVGMVGLTTGLHGAGGFGKTTLAEMVRADPMIRKRFSGGVYWVTVGRDVRGAAITAKVNDLIRQVSGMETGFSDAEQAGQRLGSLLDYGQWRLLVLERKCTFGEAAQLAPFAYGGRQCVPTVTTRAPKLLAGRAEVAILVDQMSSGQAQAVLTAGLLSIDAHYDRTSPGGDRALAAPAAASKQDPCERYAGGAGSGHGRGISAGSAPRGRSGGGGRVVGGRQALGCEPAG